MQIFVLILQQIAEASKIIDNDNFTPKTGIYDISNVCQATSPFTQDIFPPMQARCDMDSSDGGWTVLIRRAPDVVNELFNRTWDEYVEGFGDLNGEFWYGLKNMHCLTTREPMEVEVEVRKKESESIVLSYDNFRIDGPTTSYTLHVSGKSHSHYDYLSYHNGMKFSTFDRDNDRSSNNCASNTRKSGWWFNACSRMLLTYTPTPTLYISSTDAYDYAELRVRPKSCTGLKNDLEACE